MIVTKQIDNIQNTIKKYQNIEYRIINNTLGKNLILLSEIDENLLKELENYKKYIQEIILEPNEDKDDFVLKRIKDICPKDTVVHRNISYINWSDRKNKTKKVKNVIAGYSFKGGMGRSTTLAYLSYFYYLMGKKVVVLDCDFETPGIASIFFDKAKREQKAGVLDYLIDLNIEDELKLNDYFLQSEVSDNSGNLYLFPSGIDYNISNYINKISKIDFNSQSYTNSFTKLLEHINKILKPDLIFIDLRAGINESNGLILKHISNTNLFFFNSEEQNEDGLRVILTLFDNFNNNYIMNSTIRFDDSYTLEFLNEKEKHLVNLLEEELKFKEEIVLEEGAEEEDDIVEKRVISVPYNSAMLNTSDILKYRDFILREYNAYNNTDKFYIQDIISIITNKYFNKESRNNIKVESSINNITNKEILEKLQKVFSNITAKKLFNKDNNLKYFYLKDDISKIINEQIILILGAKGSGKSTLFEVFTKHHKDILSRLNISNNTYIEGFSHNIKNEISDEYISSMHEKSNKKIDIKRFWKCLTLIQIEKELKTSDILFKDIQDISNKFISIDIGLEVDKRLKNINIELIQNDKVVTLVYDELDVGFTEETKNIFIERLITFWQDNIYKYTQIRSKILLRNDIFETLNIENKTHLELNIYELKWNEKEILSLILKIFITVLTDVELEKINLLFIRKNSKDNEVIKNLDKIREAIYYIFNKKAPYGSTIDKWLLSRLEDSKGLITPRTVYKLMNESIKNELEKDTEVNKNILLNNFYKNRESILKEVSKQKFQEYDAEYKDNKKIYSKITDIGQRTFSFDEFKDKYPTNTLKKTVLQNLQQLQDSGFLSYDSRYKTYKVAYIYIFALELKINRSKGGKINNVKKIIKK